MEQQNQQPIQEKTEGKPPIKTNTSTSSVRSHVPSGTWRSWKLLAIVVVSAILVVLFLLQSRQLNQLTQQPTPSPTTSPTKTPYEEGQEVMIQGMILENNLGCAVDANCFLRIGSNNQEFRVTYFRGWEGCPKNEEIANVAGKLVQGDRVEIFGKYGRLRAIQTIEICNSSKYYIRRLSQEIDTSTTSTSSVQDWQTYRNDEFGFEVRYPRDWKEGEFLLQGSGFTQDFQDSSGQYSFSFSAKGNYNQITGKPYRDLYEYINLPYTVKTINVGGQEAIQPLPRAGSEHINSAMFFSKDFTFIYTITLSTNNVTEENIEAGKSLFDQILSTFRFVDKD